MVKRNQLSKPKDFILNIPRPSQIHKVFKAEIGGTLSPVCQMVRPTNKLRKHHTLGAVHLPCTSPSLGVCQGAISTLTKHTFTMMVGTGNVLK